MTASTMPGSSVSRGVGLGSASGPKGYVRTPGVVPAPVARSSIRMAGLADIPAIARITREGPQPTGIELAAMSQATRLMLTHVAFEHGALWVEQIDNGPILRALTAIPARELTAQHSALRDVIRRVGRRTAPSPAPVFGFGEVLLAELDRVRPVWLLVEISRESQNLFGDPALLAAGLKWARESSEPALDPVMVLTDTMPERRAAESLGFVERRTWGQRWPWWLGVAPPVGLASDA